LTRSHNAAEQGQGNNFPGVLGHATSTPNFPLMSRKKEFMPPAATHQVDPNQSASWTNHTKEQLPVSSCTRAMTQVTQILLGSRHTSIVMCIPSDKVITAHDASLFRSL
jgi:hypothetical protein